MKLLPAGLALALAAALALAPAAPARGAECTDPARSDPFACLELLVEYDPTFVPSAFHDAYGTTTIQDIPALLVLLVLAPDEATRERIEADFELGLIPGVADVGVNSRLLSPECRQLSIGVIELGRGVDDLGTQPAMSAIGAPAAWPLASGEPVLVAVADTGLDAAHPALAGRIEPGGYDYVDGDADPAEVANGFDDDGDGNVDLGYGHGTAVASLVATVAPAARLLPLRIADDECRTTAMRVAAALVDAADAGARVINLSIGMLDDHPQVDDAIAYASARGALVVVSAGNASSRPGEFPSRASAVLSVAATDDAGIKAGFSSYDSSVDVVAPGLDVLGAYPSDRYVRLSGTSFAAALASGAAALGFGQQTCAAGSAIHRLLRDRARPVDDLPGNQGEDWDGKLGDGMVDAAAIMPPGLGLGPVDVLRVVKAAPDRLRFLWTPEGEAAPGLVIRINSVETKAEVPGAGANAGICPACPAPTLAPRCEAGEPLGACEEAAPGAMADPAPALFFQAVQACGGLEGPLE